MALAEIVFSHIVIEGAKNLDIFAILTQILFYVGHLAASCMNV